MAFLPKFLPLLLLALVSATGATCAGTGTGTGTVPGTSSHGGVKPSAVLSERPVFGLGRVVIHFPFKMEVVDYTARIKKIESILAGEVEIDDTMCTKIKSTSGIKTPDGKDDSVEFSGRVHMQPTEAAKHPNEYSTNCPPGLRGEPSAFVRKAVRWIIPSACFPEGPRGTQSKPHTYTGWVVEKKELLFLVILVAFYLHGGISSIYEFIRKHIHELQCRQHPDIIRASKFDDQSLQTPRHLMHGEVFDRRYDILDFPAATRILRNDPDQAKYLYHWKHPLENISLLEAAACNGDLRFRNERNLEERLEFLRTVWDINPELLLLPATHSTGHQKVPLFLSMPTSFVGNVSIPLLQFFLEFYIQQNEPIPIDILADHCSDFESLEEQFNIDDENCSICLALKQIENGTRVVQGQSIEEDDLGICSESIEEFWGIVKLFAMAAYHNTVDESSCLQESGKSFRLLHACLGIGYFHGRLIQLLATAFPHSLFEADEEKNLPIHIAAKCQEEMLPTHLVIRDDERFEDEDYPFEWTQHKKTNIEILLAADPTMANRPNSQGLLPLHLAIEHRPSWTRDILCLLNAYPLAASVRNPLTGLYPLHQVLRNAALDPKESDALVSALVDAFPYAAHPYGATNHLPLAGVAASMDLPVTTIYKLFGASPACPE